MTVFIRKLPFLSRGLNIGFPDENWPLKSGVDYPGLIIAVERSYRIKFDGFVKGPPEREGIAIYVGGLAAFGDITKSDRASLKRMGQIKMPKVS
jgi:hypothetical protein